MENLLSVLEMVFCLQSREIKKSVFKLRLRVGGIGGEIRREILGRVQWHRLTRWNQWDGKHKFSHHIVNFSISILRDNMSTFHCPDHIMLSDSKTSSISFFQATAEESKWRENLDGDHFSIIWHKREREETQNMGFTGVGGGFGAFLQLLFVLPFTTPPNPKSRTQNCGG